jgi:hypothetical protein
MINNINYVNIVVKKIKTAHSGSCVSRKLYQIVMRIAPNADIFMLTKMLRGICLCHIHNVRFLESFDIFNENDLYAEIYYDKSDIVISTPYLHILQKIIDTVF